MIDLLALLRRPEPGPRVVRLPPMPVATQRTVHAAAAGACGWFDSSHDLRCGLVVRETLHPEALATELPVDDWRALHPLG